MSNEIAPDFGLFLREAMGWIFRRMTPVDSD